MKKLKTYFHVYFQALVDRHYSAKMATLTGLNVLLVITFLNITPLYLKLICGISALAILFILGMAA